IWSNANQSLVVTPKTQTVKYNVNLPFSGKDSTLSDTEITQIASDFLKNSFTDEFNNLKPLRVVYFAGNGEIKAITKDKRSASFFQVIFTPSISNYEIVSLNTLNSDNFVEVLPNEKIFSAQIKKSLKITTSPTLYSVSTGEEVLKALPQAKLINILGEYLDVRKLNSNSFERINITKVEIVYYDEQNSNLYQPVFRLTGPAKIKGLEKEVIIVFYLPAITQL
ncbi:MAG: hypothetical protein AAB656_02675, partial [Patescibacteria group bacterium]